MPLILALIAGTQPPDLHPTALYSVVGDTPPPVVSVVKKLVETLDVRRPGRKVQLFQNRYLLTHVIEGGFIFLVVSDPNDDRGRMQSLQFLDEVRKAWMAQQAAKGTTSARDTDWMKFLNTKLAEYSAEDASTAKLRALKAETASTAAVMRENASMLVGRNEAIESSLGKTEALTAESREMRGKAGQLHRKLWWNNVKIWGGLIACAICLLIALIILVII